MKVRRALTGSAALVMVLALAACEDSPKAGTVDTPTATESSEPETTEPETTEPETTAPEPTEEPTEPVPVLEEVPGEDPEFTFVKHFFDVYVYGRQTGDVEPFLALGTADCESCLSGAEWIDEKYDAGGHVEGGNYELREEPEFTGVAERPEVRIAYRESPITVVESAEAEPEVLPACDLLVFSVNVVRQEGQWLVSQFTVQSPC